MAAVELATGYLTLAAETSGLAKQVAKMFRGAETEAGQTGRAMGKALARGFESEKPNTDRLAEDVKRAEAKVAAHSERSATKIEAAKRKVEIAQARVNETTEKYGPKSSQALAAADRLATAEQRLKAETLSAADAQDKLQRELGEAKDALKKASDESEKSSKQYAKGWKGVGQRLRDYLTKGVEKASAEAEKRAAKGGKRASSGFVAAFKKFAAPLAGALSVGAILGKGWARLTALDNAQAKLKGLGNSGEDVAKIMENATAAVRGTAFGMDAAATTAAGAIAAGIKPGKELEKMLKAVANSAAAAGIPMEEMGSIFNKVATSNKAQMDVINQVNDRGIPLTAALAKKLNVTASEAEKMASKGQINFKTFSEAMAEASGTVADEMGKTVSSSAKNFLAAVGRMGANLLSGVFAHAAPVIQGITKSMKPLEEGAKVAGEFVGKAIGKMVKGFQGLWDLLVKGDFTKTFREVFKLEEDSPIVGILFKLREGFIKAKDILVEVVKKMAEFGGWAKKNKDWLVPLTVAVVAGAAAWKLYNMAVGGFWTGVGALMKIIPAVKGAILGINAAMAANPIGIVVAAIAALVAAFIYLWNTNEGFRNFFIQAWEKIKGAFTAVWNAIRPVVEGIVNGLREGIGAATSWLYNTIIKPVWTGIQNAISVAGGVINAVLTAVHDFVQQHIAPVFKWFYETIIKPVWDLIRWKIDFVANVLLFIFDLIKFAITKVLGPIFKGFYEKVIKPVWDGIRNFIANAWKNIGTIFRAITSFVKLTLGAAFIWFRDKIITPVWNFIAKHIDATWLGLKVVFGAIKSFLEKTLGPVFTWLRDKVIKPVWDGIKDTISTVWNKGIKPVFNSLKNFLKDNVVPAFKKGVEAIGKAWDGIKKAAGTPVYFVLETVYNKGIKATFDKVSSAIGSKARLPKADTSKIPHFAKGGPMKRGWKVVGEEGAELIHTGPGYVYTAEETKKILAGKIEAPEGALDTVMAQGVDIPSHHGVGGFFDSVLGGIGDAVRAVGDGIKKSIEWVRGGLAEAAKLVLNPVKGHLKKALGSDGFAGLYSSYVSKAIDGVIDWVKGKDQVDEFGGIYDGPINGFAKPVSGPITSYFGAPRGKYPHAGIDFAVPVGTPIRAAWPGVIQRAAWNAVTGRTGMGMLLNHGDRSTYYGHMSKFIKSVGDKVKAGEIIGLSGNTGRSTGPHLHWETWVKGTPVDPMRYLRAGANKGGKHTATLYDQGGWLPQGTGQMLIEKRIRQPEAVLDPRKWDIARDAIDLISTQADYGPGAPAGDGMSADDVYEAIYQGAREGTGDGMAAAAGAVRNNFRKGI